ncbi:uncharacterized protein IWZ02DRAFT_442533 [Phyllosticta citriasiana]|uniref:uncharacterized protein n=1 Tax=Phyllosticta citriasiana TaxID=595635 RepID=UPI0030FDC13A
MMDTHVQHRPFLGACLLACLLFAERRGKKKKKKCPSIVILYIHTLDIRRVSLFSPLLLLGAAFRMSFVRSMYPRPLFCFQRFAINSLSLLCFALLSALYQTTITTTTTFW